jgi:hypothetical protein
VATRIEACSVCASDETHPVCRRGGARIDCCSSCRVLFVAERLFSLLRQWYSSRRLAGMREFVGEVTSASSHVVRETHNK